MPRRDALSEKKRERLMQEHEQLQKLMLQARSSVRRSSLQDQPNPDSDIPEEDAHVNEELEKTNETTGDLSAAQSEKIIAVKKEPLTEKDLFRETTPTSKNEIKKPPLTEEDLFPERTADVSLMETYQKSSVVKVIFPEQNIAATIAQRNTATGENNASVGSSDTDDANHQEEYVDVLEENSTPYDAELHTNKRTRSRSAVYILLSIVVLLAGSGGYYFYYTNQQKRVSTAKQNNTPVSSTKHTAQTPTPQGNAPVQNTAESKPDVVQQPDNNQVVEKKAAIADKPIAAQKKDTEIPAAANGDIGKYKVISKAYFHDAPDESTRRKAFIIHWNNAVLTPLEEKNGFVYIVFTNHLGQTSKGWLRKQDLMRIE